ncbi:hypothetical protein [Ammoniphilus sp. YIM 78166]|nr:hypothetical protein [Ammoniphilus sp. YIM 78166]
MTKWILGIFLFGVLILGQVQDTSQYAFESPGTEQPENLPPKH